MYFLLTCTLRLKIKLALPQSDSQRAYFYLLLSLRHALHAPRHDWIKSRLDLTTADVVVTLCIIGKLYYEYRLDMCHLPYFRIIWKGKVKVKLTLCLTKHKALKTYPVLMRVYPKFSHCPPGARNANGTALCL